MEELGTLCTDHLQWSAAHLKKFTAQHSADPDEAIKTILSWENETLAMGVTMEHFASKRHLFERFAKIQIIRPWVKLCPMAACVVKHASLLELTVMLEENPFYPMCAFGIPYSSCLHLACMFQIKIKPNAHAYALLCLQLSTSGPIAIDAMNVICRKAGLAPMPPLSKLHPFGANVLDGHPLESIDLDLTPPAHLKEYVPNRGEIVTKIRERRNLDVQVMLRKNQYMWKNNTVRFVTLVRQMCTVKEDSEEH